MQFLAVTFREAGNIFFFSAMLDKHIFAIYMIYEIVVACMGFIVRVGSNHIFRNSVYLIIDAKNRKGSCRQSGRQSALNLACFFYYYIEISKPFDFNHSASDGKVEENTENMKLKYDDTVRERRWVGIVHINSSLPMNRYIRLSISSSRSCLRQAITQV